MTRVAIAVTCLFALISTVGCGSPKSDEEGVDEAKESASLGSKAVSALQFIGILPSYECGDSERNFVAKLTEGFNQQLGCTAVSSQNEGDADDAFKLSFDGDCHIGPKKLGGALVVKFNEGDDRKNVTVDLEGATVDGEAIPARVGYESCGDQDSYSVFVQAQLTNDTERHAKLDLTAQKRDGIFLIGEDTYVLDGSGEIDHPAGTDVVTFHHLTYEMAQLMPWDGDLSVSTSDGHFVSAAFDSKDAPYRTGHLTVQVDDHKPVRVPVVR